MLDVVRVVADQLYHFQVQFILFLRVGFDQFVGLLESVSHFMVEVNLFSEFLEVKTLDFLAHLPPDFLFDAQDLDLFLQDINLPILIEVVFSLEAFRVFLLDLSEVLGIASPAPSTPRAVHVILSARPGHEVVVLIVIRPVGRFLYFLGLVVQNGVGLLR